jgi:hypothetical protein
MPAVVAQQLYSQTHFTGIDGVQTVWNFSFTGGYIDPAHVKAYYVNAAGDEVPVVGATLTGQFQLTVDSPPIPATATRFVIYRDTPKDLPLVDFENGARHTEANLDKMSKQGINIAAETADEVGLTEILVQSIEATAEASDATAAAAVAAAAAAQATANGAVTTANSAVSIANDAQADADAAQAAVSSTIAAVESAAVLATNASISAGAAATEAAAAAASAAVALATAEALAASLENPLNSTGDTMTGPLVLSGAPTIDLHAATKLYVDTGLATKQASLGFTPVNKAGDVMTGTLQVGGATGLPASTGPVTLAFQHPTSRAFIGDGTGYDFRFSKRVGSVTTDLATITDAGAFYIGANAVVHAGNIGSYAAGSLVTTAVDYTVIDSAVTPGSYRVEYPGYGYSMLVFGSSGSTSTVQMEVGYNTNPIRIRNKTDSTTWSAWKTLIRSDNIGDYAVTPSNVASYALPIGGGTVTGPTYIRPSGHGYVGFLGGGATNTGYIEFTAANGNRQGYLGYSDTTGAGDSGTLNYVAGYHAFSGQISSTGNITAYSDERLKKDWSDLPSSFLQALAWVKVGTFTRIDTGKRQVGVSAQDVQAILPEAVETDEKGMLSVAYGQAALAACVELAKEVVYLRDRVRALEAKQ